MGYRVYHFYRGFRIRANENNCNAQPRAASTLHISIHSDQKSFAPKNFLLEHYYLAILIQNTQKHNPWKILFALMISTKVTTVDSASQAGLVVLISWWLESPCMISKIISPQLIPLSLVLDFSPNTISQNEKSSCNYNFGKWIWTTYLISPM